jgi:hypothetical protein
MEEVIIQSPEDLPPKKPQRADSGLIWKILCGIFFVTTIIFFIISITKGGTEGNGGVDVPNGQSNGNGSSQSGSSEPEDSLALKNFNVDIGKLVGAAGFNYGSILSIKTNADGTYMIGEIKNGNAVKFAIRSLPNGSWKKANLITSRDNIEGANNTCLNISKTELEVFSGYKTSSGGDAYCVHYNDLEEDDDSEAEDEIELVTAADAIKDGEYKEE